MATHTYKVYWVDSLFKPDKNIVSRLRGVDINTVTNIVIAKVIYSNPIYIVEFHPLLGLPDAAGIEFESLSDAKAYAHTTYLLTTKANHGTQRHPPQRQSNASQANRA